MDKRVSIEIIYRLCDITVDLLNSWFREICELFSPNLMCSKVMTNGKCRRYNRSKFFDNLPKELCSHFISVKLLDEKNSVVVFQNANTPELIYFSLIVDADLITTDLSQLVDKMMFNQGIVAYMCSAEDEFWQNAEEISYYDAKGKSKNEIKIKKRDFGVKEDIVDIEFNPGHYHMAQGIWFGCCYKMWFGKLYYQYIKKEKIATFNSCFENLEMGDEIIRITLYKDIWDYDKPQSRKIQWQFRNYVGIDEIAHLMAEIVCESDNPSIEILTGDYLNGGKK